MQHITSEVHRAMLDKSVVAFCKEGEVVPGQLIFGKAGSSVPDSLSCGPCAGKVQQLDLYGLFYALNLLGMRKVPALYRKHATVDFQPELLNVGAVMAFLKRDKRIFANWSSRRSNKRP